MRFLLSVTALAVCCGCDFFGADEQNTDRLASIDSLTVVEKKDLSVSIKLFATVPDPCWLYSRHSEFRDDKEITYRIYVLRKENAVCPQVLTTLTFPLELWVPARGEYTLRFHRSDNETLDTTITF
jgi:hypothetical protein